MALSRATIVAAALGIVRGEGWSALSMRRLAVELDVWPMAIYRHFEGRDDLVAAVAAAAATSASGGAPAGDLRSILREVRGVADLEALVPTVRDAGAPDDLTARALLGAAAGFVGEPEAFERAIDLLVATLGHELVS